MRKQIFYLTNNHLTAHVWQGGMLSEGQTFDNTASGWQAFSDYLDATQKSPAYLLTDLIEEDFQRENIPHVVGKARQALIQRKLTQMYRDTPLRQATAQGREKAGRKDDRLLFSALTNAELSKPWLDAILQQQVPLVGIYSAAMLGALIFKKLGMSDGPVLLVTIHSSGLRQSYFHEGYFRFSRLTPLATRDPGDIADIATAEIAKTRQFLTSTRLMPRGEMIHIAILAQADELQALQPHCQDTPATAYRLVDLDEASGLLDIKNLHGMALCDPLLMSLLGSRDVPSHYTLFEHSRFYSLWQGRMALYACSIAVVIGGLFLAGANAIEAWSASQQTRQLALETQAAEAQYQAVIKSMPATVANPHDMKLAVDLEHMIAQNAPVPARLMAIVSHALDRLPQIRINKLQWQVSETDGSEIDPANPPPPPITDSETTPAAGLIGVPKKPFEILLIEGEVLSFQNDYRTAMESVKQLSAELTSNKQLKVEITRQPLDIRPIVKLAGQAGNDNAKDKALFNLKLLWKP